MAYSQPQSSKLSLAPASDTKNLASLKRLNSLLLPINYRESFYKDILTNPTDAALSRVAFWDGGVSIIGGIRGKWEPLSPSSSATTTPGISCLDAGSKRGGKIYLMTICVLSPFRRLGVATALLADVIVTAKQWGVEEVYAHVWVENHEAQEWYERRGFTIDEDIVEGYYRKLRPSGAKVVRLRIDAPEYE
ncbi:acyl-CoA N-acyltransferase [Wilcoxina mikolae CBS 423.85]|nr:acyl-CoA N-acyltransferase [Wilcoxina mikolae CBS 423.85]